MRGFGSWSTAGALEACLIRCCVGHGGCAPPSLASHGAGREASVRGLARMWEGWERMGGGEIRGTGEIWSRAWGTPAWWRPAKKVHVCRGKCASCAGVGVRRSESSAPSWRPRVPRPCAFGCLPVYILLLLLLYRGGSAVVSASQGTELDGAVNMSTS